MSTFSRRLSVRILSFLLVFSLAYAPVALLPQAAVRSAYAQGDGGSQGDGNAGGVSGGSSIDIGIDSQGQLDGEAPTVSFGGFGSFLSTVLDFAIAVACPVCGIANFAVNVVAGTNTSIGEKVAAALGFESATSAIGAMSREVMSIVGIDPATVGNALGGAINGLGSSISEVQISTEGTVTVVDASGSERTGGNVLSNEGVGGWAEYVERENDGYAEEGEGQNVSLSADAAEVERGGAVTLFWSSEAGSSCISQGQGFTGVHPASGSAMVRNIQEDQAFLMQCTRIFEQGGGGENSQPIVEKRIGLAHVEVRVRNAASPASTTPGRPQTVPVQPAPVQAGSAGGSAPGLSVSISPSSVPAGGQATLSWSAENNASCSFTGEWPGSSAEGAARSGRDASAVSQLFNILETRTYTLSCVGADGISRAVSATVNVR